MGWVVIKFCFSFVDVNTLLSSSIGFPVVCFGLCAGYVGLGRLRLIVKSLVHSHCWKDFCSCICPVLQVNLNRFSVGNKLYAENTDFPG